MFQSRFNQLDEVQDQLGDQTIFDLNSASPSEASKHLFNLVDWQEYIRAGSFLSQTEFQLLERAQDSLDFAMGNETSAKGLCNILIKLADKCTSSVPAQQYVFTRILEILEFGGEVKNHASRFTYDGKNISDGPFLRAIRSPDNYLQRTSSEALALLLTVHNGDGNSLISWICECLASPVIGVPEISTPALTVIVRNPNYRKPFSSKGGIENVVNLLGKLGNNGPAQQLYELCFVLWTLSLEDDVNVDAYRHAGAVRILSELLSAAPSRKVVRMAAATLVNLVKTEDDGILTEMLTGGLVKYLENMIHANAHKQAGDPEVESDIRVLFDTLMRNYREYSSFDRWVVEVQNGTLRWGIVHTEKFWRENAKLLEHDDFKLLKMLIALLRADTNTVITVALYDLGEFTRFYPNGRGVVKSLGGKDIAMEMIGSENPDIQRHALQCISKIMVTNWEFMK